MREKICKIKGKGGKEKSERSFSDFKGIQRRGGKETKQINKFEI